MPILLPVYSLGDGRALPVAWKGNSYYSCSLGYDIMSGMSSNLLVSGDVFRGDIVR